MDRLKKRADFLRVAKGRAVRAQSFVLQYAQAGSAVPRVGFTVTKRQGNAVLRNRIRRRLREAVRLYDKSNAQADASHLADYVVIGRATALKTPFALLQNEIAKAFRNARASRA